MTSAERIDLLAQLQELSALCPEMRLGQLVANLALVARGTDPGAVWDVEDTELLAAAKWQAEELIARGRAEPATH